MAGPPPQPAAAAELDAPDPSHVPTSLRARAARGTLVNAGFMIGLQGLSLVKTLVVAALLTRSEYGIWGILVISLGTLAWLKDVGIGDKYVQQDEDDQELAFQKAFTLEAIASAVFLALVLAALPLFAFVYGQPELVPTGLVIAAAIPAMALRTPTWFFYRGMRFFRQRALEAVDPILSFIVTIGLAAAGLGYWSLVIGYFVGVWAAAGAAAVASPYPLRFRFERGAAREYFSFSWPLLVAGLSGVAIPQIAMLVGEAELGLAGAGAIALAATIATYADKVDQIVTTTLYPAVCRVKDRTDLLFEAFVKSNRLTLMWGVPFGVAVALFARDLVDYGLGEDWAPAVTLIQVFGLVAAANHVAFNWTAFFRARDWTVPIAVVTPIVLGAFLATALPGLLLWGLDGFAAGTGIMTAVSLAARAYYVRRLFPGYGLTLQLGRAVVPTVPAVLTVLGVRGLGLERSLGLALAEFAAFTAVTVAATLALERPLLKEAASYLRGPRERAAAAAG